MTNVVIVESLLNPRRRIGDINLLFNTSLWEISSPYRSLIAPSPFLDVGRAFFPDHAFVSLTNVPPKNFTMNKKFRLTVAFVADGRGRHNRWRSEELSYEICQSDSVSARKLISHIFVLLFTRTPDAPFNTSPEESVLILSGLTDRKWLLILWNRQLCCRFDEIEVHSLSPFVSNQIKSLPEDSPTFATGFYGSMQNVMEIKRYMQYSLHNAPILSIIETKSCEIFGAFNHRENQEWRDLYRMFCSELLQRKLIKENLGKNHLVRNRQGLTLTNFWYKAVYVLQTKHTILMKNDCIVLKNGQSNFIKIS